MKRYFKQIMSIGIMAAMLIALVPSKAMAGNYTIGTWEYKAQYDSLIITIQTEAYTDYIKVKLTRNRHGYSNASWGVAGVTSGYIDTQEADGWGNPPSPRTLELPIVSSLQPDTGYSFSLKVGRAHMLEGGLSVKTVPTDARERIYNIYTEPTIPYGFTFPIIGPNTVNIKWNNNGNPTGTNYTLQRRLDGSTTYTDVITQTNMSQYTNSGLGADTKYWYRVRVNAKNGYKFYSNEFAVTTSADPAVAAAKAAQSAAESASALAEIARIQSVAAAERTWDTTEAKSAATLAKEARDKANQTLAAINNVQSSIQGMSAPIVLHVSGKNMSTCTLGSTFDVVVKTIGATEFRTRADEGGWSSWVSVDSYATASGISSTGVHTIHVEARNIGGVVSTGQMVIFKL